MVPILSVTICSFAIVKVYRTFLSTGPLAQDSSCSGFGSYNNICLDSPNEYTVGSWKMSIIVTFKSPEEPVPLVVLNSAVTIIYELGSS